MCTVHVVKIYLHKIYKKYIYKKYKQFRAAVASRPASLEPAHTRALTMYDHFPGANILPEFVKKNRRFQQKAAVEKDWQFMFYQLGT